MRPTSDTERLDRLGVRKWTGDLNDAELLRRASGEVDVVFHLAAVTAARDDAGYEMANVAGTRAIVEAIAGTERQPARLVYVSSYTACGPAPVDGVRSIEQAPAPLTAYGRTKLRGEEIVRSLAGRGVEVVVIRAPAVYGPGDRALLPYFRLIRWGIAPVPQRGENRLHLLYVEDLVEALHSNPQRLSPLPASTRNVSGLAW